MGPWMEGCVPDSIRYVPALRFAQVSVAGVPTATSVAKDWIRSACDGGLKEALLLSPGVLHVTPIEGWTGLSVVVRWFASPRPPPNCPTITSEVGTLLTLPPLTGKDKLLVRLIVSVPPVGAVITTGDQVTPDARWVLLAAQVAPAEPGSATPFLSTQE